MYSKTDRRHVDNLLREIVERQPGLELFYEYYLESVRMRRWDNIIFFVCMIIGLSLCVASLFIDTAFLSVLFIVMGSISRLDGRIESIHMENYSGYIMKFADDKILKSVYKEAFSNNE